MTILLNLKLNSTHRHCTLTDTVHTDTVHTDTVHTGTVKLIAAISFTPNRSHDWILATPTFRNHGKFWQ